MNKNKKTEVLQIRFTPEEKEMLRSFARRSKMSMAEYIQNLIRLKCVFCFSDKAEKMEFLYY